MNNTFLSAVTNIIILWCFFPRPAPSWKARQSSGSTVRKFLTRWKATSGSASITRGAMMPRYSVWLCGGKEQIFLHERCTCVASDCLTGGLSEEHAAGRSCRVDAGYGWLLWTVLWTRQISTDITSKTQTQWRWGYSVLHFLYSMQTFWEAVAHRSMFLILSYPINHRVTSQIHLTTPLGVLKDPVASYKSYWKKYI